MSFFSGGKPKKYAPTYYDPLGPADRAATAATTGPCGQTIPGRAATGTGGPTMRAQIFGQLGKALPLQAQDSAQFSASARAAAAHPGWASASGLAQRTLDGDYLHGSPEVDDAVARMRSSGQREAMNQVAGIQDQYARNGMQYGTANQQAQQSAGALATAKSGDTEAAMRMGNYQAERQLQQGAATMLSQAIGQPLEYLNQASTSGLSGLSQAAQIVAGLAGNGQLVKPDILPQDTFGSVLGAGMKNL